MKNINPELLNDKSRTRIRRKELFPENSETVEGARKTFLFNLTLHKKSNLKSNWYNKIDFL